MSQNSLPPVHLTGSGCPVFLPGEVECSLISSVDLVSAEEDQNHNFLPSYKSGLLILTTRRLLWISESNGSDPSTTAFIPLASVIHTFPPKKSIKSIFSSPRIRIQLDGRILGVGSSRRGGVRMVGIDGCDGYVDLEGEEDGSGCVLWSDLGGDEIKGMETSAPADSTEKGGGEGSNSGDRSSRRGGVRMAGVSGILRKEQELWESTDRSLQEAFQDLNALMSKAKEMVMLAEKMRLKLLSGSTGQAGAANDEEMGSKQEMQDWLLSIGIASPVTKESAGALYHRQLSCPVFSCWFLRELKSK